MGAGRFKESTPADPVAHRSSADAASATNLPRLRLSPSAELLALQQLQEFLFAYRAITWTVPGGLGNRRWRWEVADSCSRLSTVTFWLVDLCLPV